MNYEEWASVHGKNLYTEVRLCPQGPLDIVVEIVESFFGECYFKVGRSTAKAEFINGEWIIHTYEHTSSNMDPIGPYAHAAVMQAAMEYIKRQRDTKP